MKILVSAFGPFGSIINNPTERLLDLIGSEHVDGCELTSIILPVSYKACSTTIAGEIIKGGYDAIVLLGVASGDSDVRLEKCAFNLDESHMPDVDGELRIGVKIEEDGPDSYQTAADINSLLKRLLDVGLPARISENAGGYCCNHVYYEACYMIDRLARQTIALFIHFPADEISHAPTYDGPMLVIDKQFQALRLVLTEIGDQLQTSSANK